MKTSLKINVHSVVDIITNSSTTVYTMADEGTIKAVKEMVNALLAIGESKLTADDLFTFTLYSEREREYQDEKLHENVDEYSDKVSALDDAFNKMSEEKFGTRYGWDIKDKTLKAEYDTLKSKYYADGDALFLEYYEKYKDESWINFEYDDDYYDVDMKVSTKLDDENAKIAGNILNRLDGLFQHEGSYN